MDDATRLVSELQCKLVELDSKVAAYRQDMALEFRRYSDQLLRDVPAHVSAAVQLAIAESMDNYPDLRGSLSVASAPAASPGPSPAEQPGSASSTLPLRAWRGSPPPVLPHTSGKPSEAVRDPHAREQEFQGLFTPSYLPLLDERSVQWPPTSPPPPAMTSPPLAILSSLPEPVNGDKEPSPAMPSAEARNVPHPAPHASPLRAGTSSSLESGSSDSKIRRSALSRSSSSSMKASPRRVRFDFEGEEVFPTSSPESSRLDLAQMAEASSAMVDDSYNGLSLADIEDEEPAPPKKVSSSQALRALSKMPLDQGTVWTVVNPNTEIGASSNSTTSAAGAEDDSSVQTPTPLQSSSKSLRNASKSVLTEETRRREKPPISPLVDGGERQEQDEGDESEDEFVSIRSTRHSNSAGQRGLASDMLPNLHQSDNPTTDVSPHPPAPPQANHIQSDGGQDAEVATTQEEEQDDDDLFGFDGEDIGIPAKANYANSKAEVDEHGDDGESTPLLEEPPFDSETLLATSPGFSITAENPRPGTSPAVAAGPPPSAFNVGSVGSYKGRSLTFDVIRDRSMHDRAAAMGNFNTFVGSVDGRSGIDEADPSSFRASLGSSGFSGTPRSLTHRMALENAKRAAGGADKVAASVDK